MKHSRLMPAILAGAILIAATSVAETFAISKAVSESEKQDMLRNDLTVLALERAQSVRNYVSNAEQRLIHFSKAAQVTDLLNDPKNKELAEKAQKYTEEISKATAYVEGFYIADSNSTCLAHTNRQVVGIFIRNPETMNELKRDMFAAGDGVYNSGIRFSPTTGKPLLFLYKAVCSEQGDLLGFVSHSMWADPLMEGSRPNVKGAAHASYAMLDAKSGTYLLHSDNEMLGKAPGIPEIKALCSEVSQTKKSASGTIDYQNCADKYISAYSYIPEYGWLITLDAQL